MNPATLQKPNSELIAALAPTGSVRSAINLGNAVLAKKGDGTNPPTGVSVDLAQAFADFLGLKLELKVVTAANDSVKLVNSGQADMGFFAIDPLRSQGIAFTAPYVLIEGAYLVRNESKLQRNVEVDVAANRIMVAGASAYDLYLSREIKNAKLERVKTSQEVVSQMLSLNVEVAAGVKQQLEADAKRLGGVRLLPGRFMVIEQACGIASNRGAAALQFMRDFVEQQKRTGFVAEALKRHGIEGAAVAPLV